MRSIVAHAADTIKCAPRRPPDSVEGVTHLEDNWPLAPTSVKVGFVLGIPALLIGVVLIAIAQFLAVPYLLVTALGGAFLGGGV